MRCTEPTINKVIEHCKSVNVKVIFEYDLRLLKYRIKVYDLIFHKIFEMDFYDNLKTFNDTFIITEIDKKLNEIRGGNNE